jgi:aspartate aminotransferase
MPSVSKRGEQTPLSPFRKLIPIADRVKAAGKKVYHLNIGQPDIETPAAAMAAVRATNMKILAYSPAEGNASYREKLVGYYGQFGVDLQADNIMITTGGSEAIQFMFLSCLDKGDEVIIPEPFYANYNGFAHIGDIKITPITSTIDTGFALPAPEAFEAIIGPRTKAIFITNPNNPTGCFYPKEALKQLATIVKKHDLFLFVDEVYREFCYDDQEFFSALNLLDIQENVVVIDSISKRYSACGARIGALVTYNQDIIAAASRFAKLRLSPPGLAQIFAEATLDVEETYLPTVKKEYDKRRQTVYRRLQAMPGVVSYNPGGAFYCFAQFPIDDADAFCQWLLEDFELDGATVMLSPGQGFYATPGLGHNEVRIAYVLNTQDLEAAMDCLEEALISYPGRVDNAVEVLASNS